MLKKGRHSKKIRLLCASIRSIKLIAGSIQWISSFIDVVVQLDFALEITELLMAERR